MSEIPAVWMFAALALAAALVLAAFYRGAPRAAASPTRAQCSKAAQEIAVIDRALLDDLLNGIGADAERLLDTFFEETERRLSNLQALSIDARDAIYLEAHTLKGSCGMVGLKRMSELAHQLEHRSATMAAEAYYAAVGELAHAYVVSRDELTRYVARRGIVPAFAKK